MTTIGFGEPSTGSTIKAEELKDHLIVVRPTGHEEGINTVHGVKDAVRVDIDDVETGETYEGALFFQGNLIGSFKGAVGTQLLGRIVTGQAKPGQNAPYLFQSATANQADVQRATAFLTAKTAGSFAQPPAEAPAPAGAPAAAPTPEQIAAGLALLQQQQAANA